MKSFIAGFVSTALLYLLCTVSLSPQQTILSPSIPDKFDLDMKTAARLRPMLFAHSTAISDDHRLGFGVFEQLIKVAPTQKRERFRWELRISLGSPWNAYSSPDGTVYVDRSLARLADSNAGLWAAILSHEIAHVLRRDWARRYLYEKSLQEGVGVTLGSNSFAGDSWIDGRAASAAVGSFCRQMEVEADAEGVMLMARAGYHPDFAFALHHLLRAKSVDASSSVDAMHPRWELRDRELKQAYNVASIEFDRLWPERNASPGGNPPILVFAEEPITRNAGSGRWEIRFAMHCQNLAGTVEVVLQKRAARGEFPINETAFNGTEIRELTGCTSDRTLITLTLADTSPQNNSAPRLADVYVLDDRGSILSRADIRGLHR